jgi:hypothetical protein
MTALPKEKMKAWGISKLSFILEASLGWQIVAGILVVALMVGLAIGAYKLIMKYDKMEAVKDALFFNPMIKSLQTVYLNLCFGAFTVMTLAYAPEVKPEPNEKARSLKYVRPAPVEVTPDADLALPNKVLDMQKMVMGIAQVVFLMALVFAVLFSLRRGYKNGEIKKEYAKRRFRTLWDGLDNTKLHSLNFQTIWLARRFILAVSFVLIPKFEV